MKKRTRIDEVVDKYGNRYFIENGEVNTILCKDIQNSNGDMSLEQLREVLKNEIKMVYSNELHI